MAKLELEFNKIFQKCAALQGENQELANKLDNLEQYGRHNVCIFAIASENKEERIDRVVTDFFKQHLQIDIKLDRIDRCHRLGSGGMNKPRAIIVKFLSYCD